MSGTCNIRIKCWPKQLNGGDPIGDQIKNGATVLQWILISRVQTEFLWPRIKKKMGSHEQGRDISSSTRGGEVIGTIFLRITLLSGTCPVGPSGNMTAFLFKGLVRFSLIYVSFSGCLLRVTSLLDTSAKLRKATVSSVTSVCPSVYMEQLCCHWADFRGILYFNVLRKSVEKIQVELKCDNNNGYFTWRPTWLYDHISFKSS
jgi:hypothetical protein